MRGRAFFAALMLVASGGVDVRSPAQPIVVGDHYVAMGSSFAAGPGITTPAETPPTRCGRSSDNYAHQLARRLQLVLTDVSCGGATTGHLLGAWNELPPQIEALMPETRLVTITIGGNDVGYIGGLMAASCSGEVLTAMCRGLAARRGTASLVEPDEAAWQLLAARLDLIAAEVRRRSPGARLIFVDYLTILPSRLPCSAAPLDIAGAKRARAKAARLAAVTARVARKAGAGLIRASRLSAMHDACAAAPWVKGLVADGVPYHPNLAGMSAIADALEKEVRTK